VAIAMHCSSRPPDVAPVFWALITRRQSKTNQQPRGATSRAPHIKCSRIRLRNFIELGQYMAELSTAQQFSGLFFGGKFIGLQFSEWNEPNYTRFGENGSV